MADRYRTGRKLGTTIYREDDDSQPVAWFPGDPGLAALVVELLNGLNACRGTYVAEDFEHGTRLGIRHHCMLPSGHEGLHENADWKWL